MGKGYIQALEFKVKTLRLGYIALLSPLSYGELGEWGWVGKGYIQALEFKVKTLRVGYIALLSLLSYGELGEWGWVGKATCKRLNSPLDECIEREK